MKGNKMKKLLSLLTITIFFISILASVSPKLQVKFMSFSGDKEFATISVPVPSKIQNVEGQHLAVSKQNVNVELEIKASDFMK